MTRDSDVDKGFGHEESAASSCTTSISLRLVVVKEVILYLL